MLQCQHTTIHNCDMSQCQTAFMRWCVTVVCVTSTDVDNGSTESLMSHHAMSTCSVQQCQGVFLSILQMQRFGVDTSSPCRGVGAAPVQPHTVSQLFTCYITQLGDVQHDKACKSATRNLLTSTLCLAMTVIYILQALQVQLLLFTPVYAERD